MATLAAGAPGRASAVTNNKLLLELVRPREDPAHVGLGDLVGGRSPRHSG
jgi:hypothetical protein